MRSGEEMLLARLRFRHLQMVAEVELAGSLSKAAAKLNLTQPALSKALKEVEGLLAAGGDEDVVGGGGHAGEAGLFEEVVAERGVSLRGAELEDLGDLGGVEDLEAGAAEGVDGEEVSGGAGGGEADGGGGVGAGIGLDWLGELGTDEAAFADVAGEELVFVEEGVGSGDRGAVEAKILGEFAGSG